MDSVPAIQAIVLCGAVAMQAGDLNERFIQAFDLLGVRMSSVRVITVQVSSVRMNSVVCG
jgi:hypothetical protein